VTVIPRFDILREQLRLILANKRDQGHVTDGLEAELEGLPQRYDAMAVFGRKLTTLPLRPDWPHVEPNDLEEIWAECDPTRPLGVIRPVELGDSARRVEAAFLGSVCGCILGKPLEIRPTLAQIRTALEGIGEWPLNDYISERLRPGLTGQFHRSWPESVRERLAYVPPDDDLNYTILGMLLLEQHGLAFTRAQVRDLWLHQLPILYAFGPERTMLLKAGLDTLEPIGAPGDMEDWVNFWNPRDEWCGAMIRADAYGYACPGRPALAAELAWRDASFTHRRTGIYGTMFAAAAIATAQVAQNWSEIFETALKFVPRRSRYYQAVANCLEEIHRASDWLDGYYRVHIRYEQYGHCRIFQETGTLINTLRFAESVGDGICKQVSQGNDTDSYGATVGSILGAFFGPGHLEERWLRPFNDEIRTSLALFYERSLSRLAKRMGELPGRIAAELKR
jgi:ADP-ribosylglycohydrolase